MQSGDMRCMLRWRVEYSLGDMRCMRCLVGRLRRNQATGDVCSVMLEGEYAIWRHEVYALLEGGLQLSDRRCMLEGEL